MNIVRTNNGAEISPEENKHSLGQARPVTPYYDLAKRKK